MKKIVTLSFILLIALSCWVSYLILTDKITAGSVKIANGEKQLAEGRELLAQGKAKLARGQEKLSQLKTVHKSSKFLSVVEYAVAPETLGVYFATKHVIADGNQQVAQGKAKIKAGEEQLAAGNVKLHRGIERLALANKIRIACGIGAIVFISFFIVLLVCWRKSLVKLFKRV